MASDSLGITFGGASSSLNSELISKLKDSDKDMFLKQPKKSLEKTKLQSTDYAELKTLMTALSESADSFSSELTYLKRTASATGDGADVYADDGVDPQSGNIHINTIAKQGVTESKGFYTQDSIVNTTSENQVLKLKVDGKDFSIDIVPNMTLEDLKYQITDSTDGNIIASVLDTGGDKPFKLILKSKNTGADQNISVIVDEEATFDLDLKTIQEASDASFIYNGVEIQRDNNTIEDLFMGIKLVLKQDDSNINFSIQRDLSGMASDMDKFVKSYNEATKYIKKVTTFDEDDIDAASFMGDYRLNSIQSSLNNVLFQYVDSKTMTDYGLSLSEFGALIFDPTTFNEKMQEDPKAMENFLRGGKDVVPSTYTSKLIGVEYTAHSTTVNGQQITSYLEKAMDEDINIPKGSIKINDIDIGEINLLASNTPSQNAMVISTAINAVSDKTYVKASLAAGNNQLFLTDESGDNFKISSSDGLGEKIGLMSGTYFGKSKSYEGVFSKVTDYFDGLLKGSDASLNLLETSLRSEEKKLEKDIEVIIKRLDSKYDLMAMQFSSYNSLISGYTSSFSSIQMMIDQAGRK